MSPTLSIGADIGGTHITCAAVRMHEGELLEETLSRASYDHSAPAEVIFQSWANALNRSIAKLNGVELAGIGFAIPGPFDYLNGVSRMEHKFKSLFGIPLPAALHPLLNVRKELPMRFLNDASAFAVGEAWLGAGRGYDKVVVITLGTGFGSAFIEQGVPVVSGDSVPKEGCMWHLPFKAGIADEYFSTRWFTTEYQKLTGESIDGVKDLIEQTKTDAIARSLFMQFGKNLAECLAEPLQRFGAEILIMGGNISNALPLFRDAFQDGLEQAGVVVKTVVSKHSEHAALIGSARLLEEDFWRKVSADLPEL